MTTTLKPALAATLAAMFLSTTPAFASEAGTTEEQPAQEQPAAQPEQDGGGGHHGHCRMGARAKAVRAFLFQRDETGTNLVQRVVTTTVGVGTVAAVSTGAAVLVGAAIFLPHATTLAQPITVKAPTGQQTTLTPPGTNASR